MSNNQFDTNLGGMGHLAICTMLKGFYHLIASTVLKFSKSITFAPKIH